MAGRNTAVSGIYRLKDQAERALDTLIAGGIPCSSISVLLLDPASAEADGAVGHRVNRAGAIIGGTIGVLAGAGLVAVAGVGRMIGAGPIMAGLSGARAAGVVADAQNGDLARALAGIGISDLEAKLYEGHLKFGGTLVSVSCNSAEQASRAKALLTVTGAIEAQPESEPAVTWRLAKS